MAVYDYLIIGQGLAGSILATGLMQKNASLLIYDNAHASSSSVVAAGIITPVVGKRFTLSSQFSSAWEDAKMHYTKLDGHLPAPCWKEIQITRYLTSKEEVQIVRKRIADPDYAPYIAEYDPSSSSFGAVTFSTAAIVDTKAVLQYYEESFLQKEILRQEAFVHLELKKKDHFYHYRGDQFRAVISCEGWKVIANPYWQHLPMAPAKGAILSTCYPAENSAHGYNQKGWCMPAHDGTYRLGSTFSWDPLNEVPTAEEYAQVIELLSLHPKLHSSHITKIACGVRPSSRNTQPIIQEHPTQKNHFAFNGFGSRGTLWIPHQAKIFADILTQQLKNDN